MRGGSDAADIASTIRDVRLCLHCIARKTGVLVEQVSAALTTIGGSLRLEVGRHCCDACLQEKTTFSIATDQAQPPSAIGGGSGLGVETPRAELAAGTVSLTDAIWRFLQSRRGESFCMQCLGKILNASRRIDLAMMWVEGRGAVRRYGPCSTCGKDRLLCRLPPSG